LNKERLTDPTSFPVNSELGDYYFAESQFKSALLYYETAISRHDWFLHSTAAELASRYAICLAKLKSVEEGLVFLLEKTPDYLRALSPVRLTCDHLAAKTADAAIKLWLPVKW